MQSSSSQKRIPLVDLKAQYLGLKPQIDAAIQKVLDSAYYIEGPFVAEFEKDFARYCSVSEGVALDSGTAALQLGMQALGLQPGDEVIVPANTFIATAAAAAVIGLRCRFVDSDDRTWQMDPSKIEAAITPRTRAVIAVHLYGQPVALGEVQEICKRRNLWLIEDAAQAHGSRYQGRRIGSFGEFAAFSCYPAKNLGAFGDAGILVTERKDIAEKVCRLRNHGRLTKYEHSEVGYNYRMDAIQGAVLGAKLGSLDSWNTGRQKIAERYRTRLQSSPVRLPQLISGTEPIYHLFTVNTPEREALAAYLAEQNIETGVHYPVPLHLQPAFAESGYRKGDFPAAERIARETLSLPIFAEMTDEEFERVVSAVEGFFASARLTGAHAGTASI